MESNTLSKSKSKINVKLIAITAMCAALVTVTTAFIKIPSMFGYSHAGDSMIILPQAFCPVLTVSLPHQSAVRLQT